MISTSEEYRQILTWQILALMMSFSLLGTRRRVSVAVHLDVLFTPLTMFSETQLNDLLAAREDIPDLLRNFNHPPDVLSLDVTIIRDEQGTLYLVDSDREEYSFMIHGYVCYTAMASNLKDKIRRCVSNAAGGFR